METIESIVDSIAIMISPLIEALMPLIKVIEEGWKKIIESFSEWMQKLILEYIKKENENGKNTVP